MMFWMIAGTIGYFIISTSILRNKEIKELASSDIEHLTIAILWLPFVIIVPAVYLIICFINTFLEK